MTDYVWGITDHCCRVCMARVLVRKDFTGRKLYRCSVCGTEAHGTSPAAICACGIKLRKGHGQMDSGIRCVPNAERSPENMAEIVAVSVEDPKVEVAPRRQAADVD